MVRSSSFSVLDYCIFFGLVVLSLGIGIFFACRKTKTHATIVDYFLAGRKMSVLPAAMSLVVTYQSSLMMIGNPAEVYSYGLKYAYFVIGGAIAYAFAALVIVPVFHPLRLTSVYKYFYLRYQDNIVQYLVFILGLLYYTIYMASVTYGTCIALEVIIGIPQWGTIIIYTIVTAVYTSIGGMKAVIWTDVLQLVIMITGVLAILSKSILDVGGMSQMLALATNRLDMSDFRFDPRIRYQFWNTVSGATFIFLVGCYQQPGVQRINSTPDVHTARRLFVIAGPLYALFAFIISSEGVAIYAYYAFHRCDPLVSGRISNPTGIVPIAVSDLFSGMPGLPGLFIASLSSAVLSTLSSCLSSLGAITYDDIIRVRFPDLPEQKATLISKIIVFLYGIVAMSFTFIVSVLPGSIIQISVSLMGCLDGPTCGIFFASMMFRRVTSKGVAAAAIIAAAFIFWLNLGKAFSDTIISPALPSAPIDGCTHLETTTVLIVFDNRTITDSTSVTNTQTTSNPTSTFSNEDTTVASSALRNLYSTSFIGYSCYGFLITVLLSLLFSLFTKPLNAVDERYLFSFRRHFYTSLIKKTKQSEKEKQEILVEMEPMKDLKNDQALHDHY